MVLPLAVAAWLVQSSAARADPAAAEALFREGRALLERGELEGACQKLEASYELDSSAGTLLNLATCRSKQGRTATAWAHFVSAEHLARNQNRMDQAVEAKRRSSELEPRLSTLTLNAPAAAPPGFLLKRAGQIVQPASFGSPIPVDPGRLSIEASAPGYETLRLEVTVGSAADHRVVELPSLKKLALAEPASAPAPAVAETSSEAAEPRSTVLPWVIGGVGGATLAAGSVLGVMALSSNSEAEKACDRGDTASCDETQQRRDGQALASTVCVGVGVVGLGVAALWLLTGRPGRPTSAWSYHGHVARESAFLQMRVGF